MGGMLDGGETLNFKIRIVVPTQGKTMQIHPKAPSAVDRPNESHSDGTAVSAPNESTTPAAPKAPITPKPPITRESPTPPALLKPPASWLAARDRRKTELGTPLQGTELPAEASTSLNEWRGSLTTFTSFYETKPASEHLGITWDDVEAILCPEKPNVLEDKKKGTFFVPCALQDAPLVSKSLELAQQASQPTTGKMRSKAHVTDARMLVLDLDGLEDKKFTFAQEKLKSDGITYTAYTTHSHGSTDKRGIRARVVVPVDRAMNTTDYSSAWHGFDQRYFDGAAGKADSSGAHMYQQQGTWACHPDRETQAQKWTHSAGTASVEALVKRANPMPSSAPATSTEPSNRIDDYPPSDANLVSERCNQIRDFRDTKGANQKEPVWFDCLGVVGHCVDGDRFAQEWSSGHSEYSEAKTTQKLQYRLKSPPTTCAQFRKTNLSGCEGCKENVKSPIVLGYERQTFTPETTTVSQKAASSQNTDTKAPPSSNEASTAISDAGKTPFPIIEPSKEPADPAKVLDAVHSQVCQYIVADFHLKIAITLWIVMTWFIDRISVAPLLLITAAERESGKSQLLSLIGKMCARPLTVSNMTMAFIFRAITKWRPTMLIDEVDTFLRENAEQRGLINAGHTRGSAYVGRVSGDEHEPTMYDVWSAKALAGIALEKHLTDATMSRGIVISLRRKLKGETVGRLRHADQVAMNRIASELARFEQDYGDQVSQARPTLPEALSDRQQDNWEPLFAIAACAGPEWLARCEEAALALSSAASLAEDTGNSLLSDIRDIFYTKKCDKISSADLIEALIKIADAGWSTYNRGHPLAPRQVARLLKPYGIIPKTIRLGTFDTPKGYDRAQFEDAFKRYLPEPASPGPQPAKTLTPAPPPDATPETGPDDLVY